MKCHLLPRQLLRREFRHGIVLSPDGVWLRLEREYTRKELRGQPRRRLVTLINDPRSWVWGCGGLAGVGGHHGSFDTHCLQVERWRLPAGLEQFCDELGIAWWLVRRYGHKRAE